MKSHSARASPSLPPITAQPIRLAEYDEQAKFSAWRCGVSRPASVLDADPQVADAGYPSPSFVKASDGRNEIVGRIRARHAVPPKGCQTVGAECFADQMGPLISRRTVGWALDRTRTLSNRWSRG
jgi:hypothetical protein